MRHEPYPAKLYVSFPESGLSRTSTLFRLFLLIPGAIVHSAMQFILGFTRPVLVLIILFTGRYPRALFEIHVDILRFIFRHRAYWFLLTDAWEFDPVGHPVDVEVKYPGGDGEVHRWLPLIAWFLAVPHYFILAVWHFVAVLILPLMWIYILVTGRMARGLFEFYADLLDWNLRVSAYTTFMAVDRYPPINVELDW